MIYRTKSPSHMHLLILTVQSRFSRCPLFLMWVHDILARESFAHRLHAHLHTDRKPKCTHTRPRMYIHTQKDNRNCSVNQWWLQAKIPVTRKGTRRECITALCWLCLRSLLNVHKVHWESLLKYTLSKLPDPFVCSLSRRVADESDAGHALWYPSGSDGAAQAIRERWIRAVSTVYVYGRVCYRTAFVEDTFRLYGWWMRLKGTFCNETQQHSVPFSKAHHPCLSDTSRRALRLWRKCSDYMITFIIRRWVRYFAKCMHKTMRTIYTKYIGRKFPHP